MELVGQDYRDRAYAELGWGNTETICSKLKSGNRFLKPNFETLPKLSEVRQVRRVKL